MKASAILPGDVFKDDAGRHLTVASAKPTRAFRMALEGYPERYAIMVFWKGFSEWELFHPDDDLGPPVKLVPREAACPKL